MNSSTLRPAFLIWSARRPGASSRCCGIDSERMDPSLRSTTWLPRCLETRHPARSSARTASAPETLGSLGKRRDLHLAHIDRERKTGFFPCLQTQRDGFPDVFDGFVLCPPLACAPGDGRALDDEPAVLVAIHRDGQLHAHMLLRMRCARRVLLAFQTPRLPPSSIAKSAIEKHLIRAGGPAGPFRESGAVGAIA